MAALASPDGSVVPHERAFWVEAERTFVLLHELAHQVDFQLLTNADRGAFYEAAGFGAASDVTGLLDRDWITFEAAHRLMPADQFASAFALVVWPVARGNVYVGRDGTCKGWLEEEGCAAPRTQGSRPVATTLAAVAGLGGASPEAESVLRARLSASAGALPGLTVVLDYRDRRLMAPGRAPDGRGRGGRLSLPAERLASDGLPPHFRRSR